MTPVAKLGAFAVLLVAMAGVGAGIGSVAGPIEVDGDEPVHAGDEHGATTTTAAHGDAHAPAGDLPAGGLLVAQDGYRFAPSSRVLEPAVPQPFTFRILGPDGAPVHGYDVAHDKELHLVVVARDLGAYAHVHPERAEDGTWSVELPALPPGPYRAYADFVPTGADPLTLGVDLTVVGTPAAPQVRPEVRTATVADYTVTLEGDAASGDQLTVTVRRHGEVVTTEPYLGAAGHLVAIRDGDLAYLHVHPLDEVPSGPVRFAVEVPSEGRYALFFDFAHDGVVHTASFLVSVGPPAAADGDGDDHTHAEGEEH